VKVSPGEARTRSRATITCHEHGSSPIDDHGGSPEHETGHGFAFYPLSALFIHPRAASLQVFAVPLSSVTPQRNSVSFQRFKNFRNFEVPWRPGVKRFRTNGRKPTGLDGWIA